ncbi:LysM peptidoglycan-binding domain-containing protein [Peribacillus asahii]|uniref:LysM peptidoglycan-binding domain-containing protein n=1 Tax=Peribacillus asahii TaxID=228899 RepID=UPI002079CB7A|nr:LysM domain-containing protein [Peribacillus asahii]USK71767.1 LysM peptidoglycan-binding domain-containing protein [Peribacillus asahii]
MGKLGGYKIANIQESFNNTVNVTSYPTEKGLPITDSVQRQPKTFAISGKILGKTAKEAETIRSALEKKQNAGTLVTYVGRINAKNVIITNMSGTYDATIANGLSATFDLQQIRIAKTPYVKKKTQKKNSGKKTVSKKTTSSKPKKQYHVVKAGDTYWGCARKYGTTVAALRKLNPWPDRKIPIGVKMRIR